MGNRRLIKQNRTCRLKRHRAMKNKRKSAKKLAEAKKHIYNFTNYELSDCEISILGKGLKFIPTPSLKGIKQKLLQNFKLFARKLRCTYELEDGSEKHIHPFYTKSKYDPQIANNAIENYIFQTKMEIDNMTIPKFHSNITKDEWCALQNLKKRYDLVIKKADKGSAIVILPTNNYIQEGYRQLCQNQRDFY